MVMFRLAHELFELLKNMDKAHEYMHTLFEESITDTLRERMNVRAPAV